MGDSTTQTKSVFFVPISVIEWTGINMYIYFKAVMITVIHFN